MKARRLKIALVFSLLFNLSAVAGAAYVYVTQHNTWTTPFGAKLSKDRFLFDEMALSQEQAQKMRAAAIPFRAKLEQKRSEIITLKMQLLTLLRNDMPDRKALDATLTEIGRLQGEVEGMVLDHILLEKSKLDKVQQQKFLDLLQKTMQPERLTCFPVK